MIKLNDIARQNLPLIDEFVREFVRLTKESKFILRNEVSEFELNIKNFLKTNYGAIGVNSGTDALFLAMQYANLGRNSEVLVPSRTYIASVSAIHHVKAVPIFVDIGDDLNLNLDDLEAKITPLTRAIMPVHLSGHPCNMDRILEIAKRNHLSVIEDAAQAIGAQFKGKAVGTFGNFGAISLHPLKSLGVLGDGGLLLVKDEILSEQIRIFRDHAHPQPKIEENYMGFGINSRLDNMQAAFASIKLNYLDIWINRRRKIAKQYSESLMSTPLAIQAEKFLTSISQTSNYFDTFNSFVISVNDPLSFQSFMLEGPNPVEVSRCFRKPLHNHPTLMKQLGTKQAISLPKTEYYAERTISLPIYPELTDLEVELISEKINAYTY
jgi:dTDP-4-amino-4,6-dideoxygalactose transaminase